MKKQGCYVSDLTYFIKNFRLYGFYGMKDENDKSGE